MAGSALSTHSMAMVAGASELAEARTRKQWEVEFSRFFNFQRPSTSAAPAALRALSNCKIRTKGFWMTSSSSAILLVHKPQGASARILSVTIPGYSLEEHFVSNLLFSWPQVSCVSQCPIRGSRVVFASYMDATSQIQKFAVRFLTCSDAEAFLNFVKESSSKITDNVPQEGGFVCENSSQSEIISSSGLPLSFEEPVVVLEQERPASSYSEQPESSHRSVLSSSVYSSFSSFNPSFGELLTNCLNNTQKVIAEPTKVTDATDIPSRGEVHPVNRCLNDASKLVESMSAADFMSEIVKCMSDATFHDILFKLENVIDELGVDLSLRFFFSEYIKDNKNVEKNERSPAYLLPGRRR